MSYLATVREQIEASMRRLKEMEMVVNDVPVRLPTTGGWGFVGVEGCPGLQMCTLEDAGTSCVWEGLVRGKAGTCANSTHSVPQAVRINILEGAILWWQDSAGELPSRYNAGDTITLAAGERHRFTILEDYLSHNTFYEPTAL